MRGIRGAIILVLGAVSTATATCPAGHVKIAVLNRRGGAAATSVLVTGKMVTSTCRANSAAKTDYRRSLTIPAKCSGSCTCGTGNSCTCEPGGVPRCEYTLRNVAPGEWLHRVQVSATTQKQYRRALVMGDPSTPASVQWIAYKSVLTVTSDLDGRRAGTLRHAIARASGANGKPPTLIQFDHTRFAHGLITVHLSDPAQLRFPQETIVDGTDANGDPSPVSAFAKRSYKTIIELDPTDKARAHVATLRFNSAGSGLRGVYVRRVLGADELISRRDQDLVAFGPGAVRGFVDASKLDGGSAHRVMQDCPANTRDTATNPAQGKDCIDVEDTGSLAFADAVVVSQSELRHCYDRAVKSQNAATIVRDSWIHHNGRGALFAQSQNGKLQAVGNLVEENGKNCPAATRCRGGPRHGKSCCGWGLDGIACRTAPALPTACPGSADPGCGVGTCVPIDELPDVSHDACGVSGTRLATAQLSAESGRGTELHTRANTVRNGMRRGVFYRDNSSGSMRDDFICGMQFGIETTTGAGRTGQIVVGGSASVLNSGAGVLLNQQGGTVADISFGDTAADPPAGMRNAFSNNGATGAAAPRNFDMGSAGTTRKAEGNQWQHGGVGTSCRAAAVTANDVAFANASVDVDPCEAQRDPSGGSTVVNVFPKAARFGEMVHIIGTGFNAVDGYGSNDGPGGATTCAALAVGNTCGTVPRGTCVEFERPDGGWRAASSILAVTPTHLLVRSPIDCAQPGRVRIRRKLPDGRAATFTSASPIFCRNE